MDIVDVYTYLCVCACVCGFFSFSKSLSVCNWKKPCVQLIMLLGVSHVLSFWLNIIFSLRVSEPVMELGPQEGVSSVTSWALLRSLCS